MRKHSQGGPLDSLSIFYVIGEPKLGFQKHERKSTFFEILKTFIPRREERKQSQWDPLKSFHYI